MILTTNVSPGRNAPPDHLSGTVLRFLNLLPSGGSKCLISRGSLAAVGMTGGFVTGTGAGGLVAVGGGRVGLDVVAGVGGTGVGVADGLTVGEGLTVGVGLGVDVADGGTAVGTGVAVGGIAVGAGTRVAVACAMEAGVLQAVKPSIVIQTISTADTMWVFMGPPVAIILIEIVARVGRGTEMQLDVAGGLERVSLAPVG